LVTYPQNYDLNAELERLAKIVKESGLTPREAAFLLITGTKTNEMKAAVWDGRVFGDHGWELLTET
jgi:Ni,Fe-hydrogenase III small subunit